MFRKNEFIAAVRLVTPQYAEIGATCDALLAQQGRLFSDLASARLQAGLDPNDVQSSLAELATSMSSVIAARAKYIGSRDASRALYEQVGIEVTGTGSPNGCPKEFFTTGEHKAAEPSSTRQLRVVA